MIALDGADPALLAWDPDLASVREEEWFDELLARMSEFSRTLTLVILVAAAGNCVQFTVAPAISRNCIGVSGI